MRRRRLGLSARNLLHDVTVKLLRHRFSPFLLRRAHALQSADVRYGRVRSGEMDPGCLPHGEPGRYAPGYSTVRSLLLDLAVFQLHRGGATEARHRHLEAGDRKSVM